MNLGMPFHAKLGYLNTTICDWWTRWPETRAYPWSRLDILYYTPIFFIFFYFLNPIFNHFMVLTIVVWINRQIFSLYTCWSLYGILVVHNIFCILVHNSSMFQQAWQCIFTRSIHPVFFNLIYRLLF